MDPCTGGITNKASQGARLWSHRSRPGFGSTLKCSRAETLKDATSGAMQEKKRGKEPFDRRLAVSVGAPLV